MKLKFISDGTPEGTKLVDENGNKIEHVSSVEWKVEAGNEGFFIPELSIKLFDVEVEINSKTNFNGKVVQKLQ